MSRSNQNSGEAGNTVLTGASSEAQEIISAIRDLRQRILAAWHERGVMLTSDEQRELQGEITYTCELLTDLTSRA